MNYLQYTVIVIVNMDRTVIVIVNMDRIYLN